MRRPALIPTPTAIATSTRAWILRGRVGAVCARGSLATLIVAIPLVTALAASRGAQAVGENTATLLAVGDVASCSSSGDEATAAVVRRQRGIVALLGDIVYERGTPDEFARCYDPAWGALRRRTRPALGNHEYGSDGAAPARAYFRLPDNGWYAYRLGAWHVLVLNSNCEEVEGCARGSEQWRWARAELRRHTARCILAYWHHPRWSSGLHGSAESMADIWRLLADVQADVVLAGHDHHYERFAPIDGIRSFVVGTGGRSHSPAILRVAGSERLNWTTFGVLRLTLGPNRYDWRFVPVAGRSFTDAGSARCH